jgi:Fibronectin type III-like domain
VVVAGLTNASYHAGDEVTELLVTTPQTSISLVLALAGFERLHLGAGETKHVTLRIDPRSMSQVDVQGNRSCHDALNSRTVAHETRTNFLLTFVRDISTNVQR